MTWQKPEFARQQVNAAGSAVASPPDFTDDDAWGAWFDAVDIVNNWRTAHAFPLHTFQVYLRDRAREIDKHSIVAQRIKRMPAIMLKLGLLPHLKLATMQDIGGCRAVVNSVRSVRRLETRYEQSRLKHVPVHRDDYIASPRESGYRGVHLVYRYYSDKSPVYNGLKVELQLRTRLQHAWATAVETVGTFRRQPLKSGLGDEQWLRFFALMGSVLATRERAPLVPGTPEGNSDLVEELRWFVHDLDVIEHLTSYRALLDAVPRFWVEGGYFLLRLSTRDGQLHVTPYSRKDSDIASSEYLRSEQGRFPFPELDEPTDDSVLVSVDSMKALRAAYPNYFADTRRFTQEVMRAIR